jgi:hypothetical protein
MLKLKSIFSKIIEGIFDKLGHKTIFI